MVIWFTVRPRASNVLKVTVIWPVRANSSVTLITTGKVPATKVEVGASAVSWPLAAVTPSALSPDTLE
ncbi:hypothetical protein D3C71_2125400 [compost metagenome]